MIPKQFLIAFTSFLILDFVWLGLIIKEFNTKQLSLIGRIENGKFEILYAPAILVYFLMAAAVVFYVLPGLTRDASTTAVLIGGGALGFIVYGVFDFTNLAILKNYPIPFIIVDIAWGTFAFAIVSLIVKKLT